MTAKHHVWHAAIFAAVTGLCLSGSVLAQGTARVDIVPQIGHSISINAIALSPDGNLLLSGGYENSAKLWDVASGTLLRNFEGHSSALNSVAFAPDGRHILTASTDKTVKLWETATGRLVRTITHSLPNGMVFSAAFSPDGRQIASASLDRTIKLWMAATGALVRTLNGHAGNVNAVVFSPDGARVLSGSDDGTMRLWESVTGRLVRTFDGQAGGVTSVAFSPDGQHAIAGSESATRLFDVNSGRLIRSFSPRSGPPVAEGWDPQKWRRVRSIAFSPDGTWIVSGHNDNTINFWDALTGQLQRSLNNETSVYSLAFSRDGKHVFSGGGRMVKMWEMASGKLIRDFAGSANLTTIAALSPDGTHALATASDHELKLWDLASGALIRTFGGISDQNALTFTPDGQHFVSTSGITAKLWDMQSATLSRTFEGHAQPGSLFAGYRSIAFSADGRWMLSGGADKMANLWDLDSGRLVRTFDGHAVGERFFEVSKAALSPDGTRALVIAYKVARLYDATTGKLLRTLDGNSGTVNSVAFSRDGRRVVTGNGDRTIKLWDAATGALLRTFQGHADQVWSAVFSPDGSRIASGGADKAAKLWDAGKGTLLRTLEGHSDWVSSVDVTPDGKRILTASRDSTLGVWDIETGRRLASLSGGRGGDWLTITSEGFFAGSRRDPDMLAIVRGVEATTIGQVQQSLFNPDLVREGLAGDAEGELRAAAKVINLEKVVDSGPAPTVVLMSSAEGNPVKTELATVSASITDRGKGVGRIEWRVNGVTAAVTKAPTKVGPKIAVTQELALDPGENAIEVVAYNGSNLLASMPARVTVTHDGPADTKKPTLHVLAIGIDAYRSKLFSRLNFAAKDARALGEAFTSAGGIYEAVRVTYVIDDAATPAKLDAVFEKLGREVHPRDTFIFFASAHGYSQHGRFYLIPSDFPDTLEALGTHAISQERLQDWIANRIKARKAMLLLDTCESGALVAGYTQSRINQPASEAAIGRLHEAIGRPVLTAAASGKAAFEGYKNHGVFTWALLDALRHGDANGNGTIELSELAAHVQNLVPKLGAELGSLARGWAVVGPTTAPPSTLPTAQAARFGSRGEDFVIAGRLQ